MSPCLHLVLQKRGRILLTCTCNHPQRNHPQCSEPVVGLVRCKDCSVTKCRKMERGALHLSSSPTAQRTNAHTSCEVVHPSTIAFPSISSFRGVSICKTHFSFLPRHLRCSQIAHLKLIHGHPLSVYFYYQGPPHDNFPPAMAQSTLMRLGTLR